MEVLMGCLCLGIVLRIRTVFRYPCHCFGEAHLAKMFIPIAFKAGFISSRAVDPGMNFTTSEAQRCFRPGVERCTCLMYSSVHSSFFK